MGLPIGTTFGVVAGVVLNESSVEKSSFILMLSVVHALLSMCLPSILMNVPQLAFCVTFIYGMIHNVISFCLVRILVFWMPDNENTIMTAMISSAYITGRMGVMFIATPLASYVHWSAPSVVLGSLSILVTAVLLTTVRLIIATRPTLSV